MSLLKRFLNVIECHASLSLRFSSVAICWLKGGASFLMRLVQISRLISSVLILTRVGLGAYIYLFVVNKIFSTKSSLFLLAYKLLIFKQIFPTYQRSLMASQALTSSCNEMRIDHLRPYHLRIYATKLEAYYECYDLPKSFTLSVPDMTDSIYHHGDDISAIYLSHLQYGLQLSLHLFISKVCSAQGVSPTQFTPNSIVILVGFLVIYHLVEVEPSMRLFGNLVSVMMTRMEGHYFFQSMGGSKLVSITPDSNKGSKLVSNTPDSNKDLKEKFVRVFKADPVLACPSWLEIRKDVLKLCNFSTEEGQKLERIHAYAGS